MIVSFVPYRGEDILIPIVLKAIPSNDLYFSQKHLSHANTTISYFIPLHFIYIFLFIIFCKQGGSQVQPIHRTNISTSMLYPEFEPEPSAWHTTPLPTGHRYLQEGEDESILLYSVTTTLKEIKSFHRQQ